MDHAILQYSYTDAIMWLNAVLCLTIAPEAGSIKQSRKQAISSSDESDSDEDVYYNFEPNQGAYEYDNNIIHYNYAACYLLFFRIVAGKHHPFHSSSSQPPIIKPKRNQDLQQGNDTI